MARITCGSFLCSLFDGLFFGRMNLEVLLGEMAELKAVEADTVRMIVLMEGRLRAVRRTNQVGGWLKDVDALDFTVRKLVNDLHNTCIFGLGHLRLLSQLGDTLQDVRELRRRGSSFTDLTVDWATDDGAAGTTGIHGRGGFLEIVAPMCALALGELGEEAASRPMEPYRKERLRHLLEEDDRVTIVGVPGEAGAGKTTTLLDIRDEFRRGQSRGLFDTVIYASIPRNVDRIQRLQQELCEALGQDFHGLPKGTEERAELLREALSSRRFLLLLDNVREVLDLTSVGVPTYPNHTISKIVFTASSADICGAMGAQAILTQPPLDPNQSWELFWREAGADAVLQDAPIRELAREIVRLCGGRPLALVTVGRALADKRLPVEWEHAVGAIRALQESEDTDPKGTDIQLFSSLKLSYDYLSDDKLRTCLLYCSLFPEGYDIPREQLIEYWIGEGLLDFGDRTSLYVARNRGHMIIRSLRAACLLQSGSGHEDRCVKLHEAVRDMALRITSCDNYKAEDVFVVDAGEGLPIMPRLQQWSCATRVSLMQGKIEELPDNLPTCFKLSTLLINDCIVRLTPGPKLDRLQISEATDVTFSFLPKNFFEFFPALRVLDLSHSAVYDLPSTIGSLRELRYLNLSYTSIKSLPKEVGELTKLRQLDLRHTEKLSVIAPEAILNLMDLQLLNMYGSGAKLVNLNVLDGLRNLTELGVSLEDLSSFFDLVRNTNLHKCVRFVTLFGIVGLERYHLSVAFTAWSRLRELRLVGCLYLKVLVIEHDRLLFLQVLQLEHLSHLSTVELGSPQRTRGALGSPPLRSLSYLSIDDCPRLQYLQWVDHLPPLEEIHVHSCTSMEQLLINLESRGEDGNSPPLPRLRTLSLRDLSNLKTISGSQLLKLPSLEALQVENCPMLKQLLQ